MKNTITKIEEHLLTADKAQEKKINVLDSKKGKVGKFYMDNDPLIALFFIVFFGIALLPLCLKENVPYFLVLAPILGFLSFFPLLIYFGDVEKCFSLTENEKIRMIENIYAFGKENPGNEELIEKTINCFDMDLPFFWWDKLDKILGDEDNNKPNLSFNEIKMKAVKDLENHKIEELKINLKTTLDK